MKEHRIWSHLRKEYRNTPTLHMSVLQPTGCPSTISGAANSRFGGGRTSRFLVTFTASPISTNLSTELLPDKSTITFSG